jgi:hypothetical protein
MDDQLTAFFRDGCRTVCVGANGVASGGGPGPGALLAGAFNPVHAGHWGLAAAAERLLGQSVHFELCVNNVDKPPFAPDEVLRRLRPFAGRATVWLTRAATFVEKADLFPGSVFVMGADTAIRVVAPRYYPTGAAGLTEALRLVRQRRCRFLVAGRQLADGALLDLGNIDVPSEFADLFTAIPAQLFRLEISSTRLRGTMSPGQHE